MDSVTKTKVFNEVKKKLNTSEISTRASKWNDILSEVKNLDVDNIDLDKIVTSFRNACDWLFDYYCRTLFREAGKEGYKEIEDACVDCKLWTICTQNPDNQTEENYHYVMCELWKHLADVRDGKIELNKKEVIRLIELADKNKTDLQVLINFRNNWDR